MRTPEEGVRRIGNYRLMQLIGEGGAGRVWRAVDQTPDSKYPLVAVKIARIGRALIDGMERSIWVELQLGPHVRSQHVVRILNGGCFDNEHIIVYEYVAGPSALDLIRYLIRLQIDVPVRAGLELCIHIAKGLNDLHQATDENGSSLEIVHRDLKPSNIMITRDGEAKLTDLGLALSTITPDPHSEQKITRGTPRYMSPEQVMGKDLTFASDVFSFGSTMYALIMTRDLYQGKNMRDIMKKIVRGEQAGGAMVLDALVPGLGEVLRRCTMRRQADRFSSTSELINALLELLDKLDPQDASLSELTEHVIYDRDRNDLRWSITDNGKVFVRGPQDSAATIID